MCARRAARQSTREYLFHGMDLRMSIPSWAEDVLLPAPTLNVLDLIKHPLPPTQITLDSSDPSFFSPTPPSITDARSARLLLSLPIPTPTSLCATQECVSNAENQGCQSFMLPGVGLRMPLWALDVWEALYTVDRSQKTWARAVKFLQVEGNHEMLSILRDIPWNDRLPPTMGSSPDTLESYCSTRWLSDIHMEQMGTLLQDRLFSKGLKTVSFLTIFDISTLIHTFRFAKESYHSSPSARHLRDLGEQLVSQRITSVVGYICVRWNGTEGSSLPSMQGDDLGNHWISLIADIEGRCIRVADSKGNGVPIDLRDVIIWWLQNHGISDIDHNEGIECTIQTDNFSCSILCHNALEHYFFPLETPLVPSEDAIVERMRILRRVVAYAKVAVSYNHRLTYGISSC